MRKNFKGCRCGFDPTKKKRILSAVEQYPPDFQYNGFTYCIAVAVSAVGSSSSRIAVGACLRVLA